MERCKMSEHAKIRFTRWSRVVDERMSALPLALTQDQPSMNWDFRSFSLAVASPDVKKKTCWMLSVAWQNLRPSSLRYTFPWLPPCRSRDWKNCSTRKAAGYHTRDMVHTLWGYQNVLKPFAFIQQSASSGWGRQANFYITHFLRFFTTQKTSPTQPKRRFYEYSYIVITIPATP